VERRIQFRRAKKFIEGLKLFSRIEGMLKAHDVFDLTMPGLDRLVTPDDISACA